MKREIIEVESSTENIDLVKQTLRRFLKGTRLAAKTQADFLVAAMEGCTNAIRHAYRGDVKGTVIVTAEDHNTRVSIKIRDFGCKLDPAILERKPQLPPTKPGGLGIYFMQTLTDEMRYNTNLPKGNELLLVKHKQNKGKRSSS